jgi:hypothetical protein
LNVILCEVDAIFGALKVPGVPDADRIPKFVSPIGYAGS